MVDSNVQPFQAFILAAGFGTRLRPYTDHCPKPMVDVAGRSLIWRALDKLQNVGVCDVVVNLHYKAEMLKDHLREYMRQNSDVVIKFSYEDPILDTGGGVKAVLDHFDPGTPFFVIAGDALWDDIDGVNALEILSDAWDGKKMDILTLMQPISSMKYTKGVGDYDLNHDGLVKRSLGKNGAYMWTNIRLNTPKIYKSSPSGAFSFLNLMDEIQERERFYGLVYEGNWHHISTADDLECVDAYYRSKELNYKG